MYKYLKILFISILFIIFGQSFDKTCAQDNTSDNFINIVYPAQNATIKASSTFFVGSTHPKATLKINGNTAKVYPNGSFVEIVPLMQGENSFTFHSTLDGTTTIKKQKLKRPNTLKTLSTTTLEIDNSSIYPNKSLTLTPSDTLEVKFRGTGSKDFIKKTPITAYFKIGNTTINMVEEKNGFFKGTYKIKKTDDFDKTPINIFFETEGISLQKTTPGTLSTIDEDFYVIGRVISDDAVVRLNPDTNAARLSPMKKGTLLALNGEYGDYFRIKLSDRKKVWMLKKDIEMAELTDCPPISDLSKINIYSDDSSFFIVIPVEYQAPILINNISQNKLILDIYGVKENILPKETTTIKNNIISLSYSQPDPKAARIKIDTDYKHLWGYDYFFKGKNLIIELKKEPQINPQKPLENIIIAIDPGHGGNEKGSIGPTGVPEKDINLQIAKYLQQELQEAGAKVIMTRSQDNSVGLSSRVDIANNNKALLLISLHNNSLPDGQNPYITHGTSAYYYQPQSFGLAQKIQKNLVADLGLMNNGLHRQSFALTRPAKPISVLVEIAYMINPDEYSKLLDTNFRKDVAKSIKKSLEQYMIYSRIN